ncbi:hypothetical protein [Pseudomonas helvetica]|uniref:hypothetical protein n=1 Tax=Pseudomonas helvetica TaxID=3136738 RepID=UPI0032657756
MSDDGEFSGAERNDDSSADQGPDNCMERPLEGEVMPLASEGMNDLSDSPITDNPLEIDLASKSIVSPSFSFKFRLRNNSAKCDVQMRMDLPDGDSVAIFIGLITDGNWHEIKFTTSRRGAAVIVRNWRTHITWYGEESTYIYFSDLPVIDAQSVFTKITGSGGDSSTLRVVVPDTGTAMSRPFTASNGRWGIGLLPGTALGTHTITIEQSVSGFLTRYSLRQTITYRVVPTIIVPTQNSNVANNDLVLVAGLTAAPGYPVHIMNKGGTADFGLTEPANSDGYWSKYLDLRHIVGPLSITVRHVESGNEGWSAVRSFTLFTPMVIPAITAPGADTEQNQTFTLSGVGGMAGATVEIYEGFGSIKLGESGVLTGANWVAQAVVPPGRKGLVALQKLDGATSENSASRFFKIRPAQLVVTVTQGDDETMEFSGAGFTDATVEIRKLSGPGEPPLTIATVAASRWKATVSNWPPGNYTMSAIQKVSYNPDGWITSEPVQFVFTRALPIPTEVSHTVANYTPTFSGKGYTGATVVLLNDLGATPALPDTTVRNGAWTSTALTPWGPTHKRNVHIRQVLNDLWSDPWITVEVTIAPLAPEITITDDGLSPIITGNCWPGAVVNLTYSDSATVHKPTLTDDTWTFQRTLPFDHDVTHTVTVTQTVGSQTSESASKMFTIPLPKPVITSPEPGKDEEVGPDLIVKGDNGVKCATVKIRDAQDSSIVGSRLLTEDGPWSVTFDKLPAFRRYSIDATQSNSVRESERSEVCTFTVLLLPPSFEVPQPEGDLPRNSIISGRGLPGAQVSVWRQGNPEPWLREILVDDRGHWERPLMEFFVGKIVIWATQTFEQQTSKDSPLLTCNVVPNAPFMETPAPDAFVQNKVVCSGFGYTDNTGDTVTVAFADAPQTELGQVQVLADRSWSMRITLARPGGIHKLIAVQSRDGFASAPSPERQIQLGAYQPQVNVPTEGRWVPEPVAFEGKGQDGVGELVAWFNPDQTLVDGIEIAETDWRATAQVKLRPGGNWVCFQQRLAGGTESSRWAESARFEVGPPEPSSE